MPNSNLQFTHKPEKEREKMKKAPFFVLVLISILLPSSHVCSQSQTSSDSCNSNPNLSLSFEFDTSSLHCVNAWGSEGFILRYVQASPSVWNFLLSAPNTNAYIGMGFSTNGQMVGSTAIVGWVGSDGTTLEMKKYYLGGQAPNLVTLQPTDQGLQIGNSSMVSQSNLIYMAYQLIGDNNPTKHLIYSVGPQGFVPAGPNYRLTQHRDMISVSFNYQSGQFQTLKSPEASLKRTHGILNMLGWSILLAIGAMVARYMKSYDPIWFYSHVAFQLLGFVLGLAGIVCGLVLENRLHASVSKHKGLGIFILVLGCLQMSAIFARPDKASKFRKYWNWYHYIVGRVIIVVAAINVFYGIHLAKAGSKWNASFAIILVVLGVINVGLEIRRCFRK